MRLRGLYSGAGEVGHEGSREVDAEGWEAGGVKGSLRPEGLLLEEELDRKVSSIPRIHSKLHHCLPCMAATQVLVQAAESMHARKG